MNISKRFAKSSICYLDIAHSSPIHIAIETKCKTRDKKTAISTSFSPYTTTYLDILGENSRSISTKTRKERCSTLLTQGSQLNLTNYPQSGVVDIVDGLPICGKSIKMTNVILLMLFSFIASLIEDHNSNEQQQQPNSVRRSTKCRKQRHNCHYKKKCYFKFCSSDELRSSRLR